MSICCKHAASSVFYSHWNMSVLYYFLWVWCDNDVVCAYCVVYCYLVCIICE